MKFALLALGGVAVLALLLHLFLTTPPENLARRLRLAGGVALLCAALGLALARQFAVAIPIGVAGYMILRRHAGMRGTGAPRQESTVRSAGLDMALDHGTGEMDGRVLAGRHEGRMLSQLSLAELVEVAEDLRGDADSLRLLESYLDRRHPGWRDDVQSDAAARQRPPPGPGGMSAQEAYEILGLHPGAGEAEVREAHRRLMKQLHPDHGGTSALAAKVNQAKDRILGRHGR